MFIYVLDYYNCMGIPLIAVYEQVLFRLKIIAVVLILGFFLSGIGLQSVFFLASLGILSFFYNDFEKIKEGIKE